VTLLWNTPVSGLTEEGAIAGGRERRAKWVIGADGIHSRVRVGSAWIPFRSRRHDSRRDGTIEFGHGRIVSRFIGAG